MTDEHQPVPTTYDEWILTDEGHNPTARQVWNAATAARAAEVAALKAENERARKYITDYELDYDAIMRGEKCAMEIAIDEAKELRRVAGELAECVEELSAFGAPAFPENTESCNDWHGAEEHAKAALAAFAAHTKETKPC